MIYFDDDTRFAVREFDLMKSGKLNHKGLVQLHEAYMVRKYLILILDFVEGKTLLDQFKGRHSATEDDVAFIIGELYEISSEAKDFIKKCLIRAPEMRMTAEDALKHPWF